MHVCWLLLFVGFLSCLVFTKGDIQVVLLNKFKLRYAGFSTLVNMSESNASSWSLVISCFDPIPETIDDVFIVPDIGSILTESITPKTLTNKIIWPNGVVSANILAKNSLIVPSGFLVPGKTKGNLYFLNGTTPISLVPQEDTHWFYHDADFKDVNMDGFMDVVAGRANVPVKAERAQTQLIWLKNPGKQEITSPWELHILKETDGPDIDVQFARIDNTQVREKIYSIYINSVGSIC